MRKKINIPEQIMEVLILYTSQSESLDDWMDVKKLILKSIHPNNRRLFSRRDEKTKIPNFNEFEEEIVNLWEEITGNRLNTDRCIRYDSLINHKQTKE